MSRQCQLIRSAASSRVRLAATQARRSATIPSNTPSSTASASALEYIGQPLYSPTGTRCLSATSRWTSSLVTDNCRRSASRAAIRRAPKASGNCCSGTFGSTTAVSVIGAPPGSHRAVHVTGFQNGTCLRQPSPGTGYTARLDPAAPHDQSVPVAWGALLVGSRDGKQSAVQRICQEMVNSFGPVPARANTG